MCARRLAQVGARIPNSYTAKKYIADLLENFSLIQKKLTSRTAFWPQTCFSNVDRSWPGHAWPDYVLLNGEQHQ
jgi:hypothetical protein